ncbi:hypothetical protein [Endozoicomonas sp.]|uniref:hypothetical protein n=1 Tax=Endozoicomonas sp. TaxID=1892382 RepID=UPI003AF9DC13
MYIYNIKKYSWFLILVLGVALYFVEPAIRGEVRQGTPGATSRGSFSITLKVEPCVQEIVKPDPDNPEKRCFSSPGIHSVVISCESDPATSFVVYPEEDQFCLSEELQDAFIKSFKQQKYPGNEPIIIAPE